MKNDERQLHIRLSEKVFKKLRVRCVYEDTSMQEYVTKLIAGSLGEYSNEKPDQARSHQDDRIETDKNFEKGDIATNLITSKSRLN